MATTGQPTFTLEVVTPERVAYAGAVTTVVAPATDGYVGILAHHAPMLVTLGSGHIVFRDAGGATTVLHSQGHGFLEVFHNRVTILAERLAA